MRAQEWSLSDRVSSKNVYKSANTLLPAVHKKAHPRDGHMGVSKLNCSMNTGQVYKV